MGPLWCESWRRRFCRESEVCDTTLRRPMTRQSPADTSILLLPSPISPPSMVSPSIAPSHTRMPSRRASSALINNNERQFSDRPVSGSSNHRSRQSSAARPRLTTTSSALVTSKSPATPIITRPVAATQRRASGRAGLSGIDWQTEGARSISTTKSNVSLTNGVGVEGSSTPRR